MPKREDCIHSAVCKYDDGMCATECGHFENAGSMGDEVDVWKGLASFGAAVLEYMKPRIADGMMDETLEGIAQIAVGQAVLKEVTYDPKIHVDVNEEWCDFEPGDKIYYWGKEASA